MTIRIYTREGSRQAYYDTNSLGLDQAEVLLRSNGVFRIEVLGGDRAGEMLIPAREVIRVKRIEEDDDE